MNKLINGLFFFVISALLTHLTENWNSTNVRTLFGDILPVGIEDIKDW